MAWKARPATMVSRSWVGWARSPPSGAGTSSLRISSTEPSRPSSPGRRVVGERRKRSTIRLACPAGGGGAGGVDDGVVVLQQLLAEDVQSEGDVSEIAKARVRGGLLVDAGDGLDLRMVGGDTRANEAPGCGQPLQHVHLDLILGGLEQVP